MAGKFLRGALVEFNDSLGIPTPNIIIFQYNPEGMTRTWTPAAAAGSGDTGARGGGSPPTDPLAVRGSPGHAMSLELAMDAQDSIADGGVSGALATVSGVYTRLAALEMLMFPTGTGGGLLGSVTAAFAGAASGGAQTPIPAGKTPLVLFVWGPGRILPVRVNSLSINETLYDPILLNPTHAVATVGLQVLTPEDLQFASGPLKDIAAAAYHLNHAARQALAIANLANAVDSAIGMAPF